MQVTSVITRLNAMGAFLHSPSSTELEGRRECKILLTCADYTVEGVGDSWDGAIRDALSWFTEPDEVEPWVIDAQGFEIGGEA